MSAPASEPPTTAPARGNAPGPVTDRRPGGLADTAPAAEWLAPLATWQGGPQRWTLTLTGDWRPPGGTANGSAPSPAALPLPSPVAAGAQAVFDGQGLTGWDSRLAAGLWALAEALRQRGAEVQLDGLPAGLCAVLALATPANSAVDTTATTPPAAAATASAPLSADARAPLPGLLAEAAVTAAFLGDVLIATGRWLRGRSSLRRADVLQQLDLADKYFSDVGLKPGGRADRVDLYLSVLTPAARAERDADTPLDIRGRQASVLYVDLNPNAAITRQSLNDGLARNGEARLQASAAKVRAVSVSTAALEGLLGARRRLPDT